MKPVSTLTKAILIAGLLLLFGTALMAQSSDPAIAKATEFVNLLQKGDYNAAYQKLDSNLGFKLTPDKLGAWWQKLVSQAGPFVEMKHATMEQQAGYFVVTQVVKFQKGHIDIKVALDNMMRVADIGFYNHKGTPGAPAAPAPSAAAAPSTPANPAA